MEPVLPLYTVTGDTLAPGAETHWHIATATADGRPLRTEDGRPLFTFDGDTPGGSPTGATADYVPYTGSTVEGGELADSGVDPGPVTEPAPADATVTDLPVGQGNPPESPDTSIDAGGNFGAGPANAPDSALVGAPDTGDTTTIDPANPVGDVVNVDQPVTDVSPGASTGQPSPELAPTTPEEVAADHPGLGVDQGAPLGEVPDNPSSAVVNNPNTVDQSIDSAHGWDAGTTRLDTGWVTAATLPEAWNTALRDGHGVQDDFIKIPAHLREIEDAVFALATAAVGNIGDAGTDAYRVTLEVTEESGDVRINVRIGRNAGEATGGDVTPAVTTPSTVTG